MLLFLQRFLFTPQAGKLLPDRLNLPSSDFVFSSQALDLPVEIFDFMMERGNLFFFFPVCPLHPLQGGRKFSLFLTDPCDFLLQPVTFFNGLLELVFQGLQGLGQFPDFPLPTEKAAALLTGDPSFNCTRRIENLSVQGDQSPTEAIGSEERGRLIQILHDHDTA